MDSRQCIVCGLSSAGFFLEVNGARYARCGVCQATFLDPAQRLSIAAEHAAYRLHRNDPGSAGYRRFLAKLVVPLLERLPPEAKGLDYGCGPGPALAGMLREAGHRVIMFDPLFFPAREPLEDVYDFIVCTETIEHFHRPAEEFARLDRMLRPGGWLALMTCFQTDDHRFATWHYRRDPTHVVFYREATLRHIARRFGWRCDIPVKDVALMRKPVHTKVVDEPTCHA
ncbi:MAG: class I SAM-dependent methyltransferase [Desulfobacteraceae bacterium]|jgi:SAM-dependent methyltransferase|nr:class I SAM-dependent methyltransferase [Desulfobacteraceae bacterium]